jgi:hypothetical protein
MLFMVVNHCRCAFRKARVAHVFCARLDGRLCYGAGVKCQVGCLHKLIYSLFPFDDLFSSFLLYL